MTRPTQRLDTPARAPSRAALLLLLCLACTTPPTVALAPDEACFREIAGALADDSFGGRGLGTTGLRESGDYLSRLFAALPLRRIRSGGIMPSYRQRFPAVTGIATGTDNRLGWNKLEGSMSGSAGLESDFMPFGFSSSGAFEGDVVFAGYGIVAEPLDYDDYAGLDTQGKVVLAMRYEPGESDPHSPFDGKRPSRFSDLRYKALKAREAGAAALILVSTPSDDEDDPLPRLARKGPLSDAGIPVLQITRKLASRWLSLAGHDLATLHAALEADYRPHSLELPGLHVSGTVDLETRHTEIDNVLGIFPGRGALANEAVIVGAHFDHLGRGGPGSLAPERDAIHNGADDNASGVAAMICGVAGAIRSFEADQAPRRSLIVAGFNGEETGLLGSAWYVRNPVFPIDKTVAMVNLDMVGRLREQKLNAMGADSSPDWKPLLEPLAERYGLDLLAGGDGYGPSDQMSFYGAGVPVVHFFTGSHPEYHTPEDDIEKLNISGGSRIAQFLGDLLVGLVHRTEPLAYQASSSGPLMAGDSRGFGAYLGSIPDYAEMMNSEGGVLLSGVRQGGPADVAGITRGDRIIEMDGTEIHNLYDMTFVLRDHRPGQIIEIKILRGDKPVTVSATLGRRGKASSPDPDAASPHAADPPAQGD
ncbi:MAG: M28 family peptidase [Deltaproteobacteria bacterium]|nr:M28 family peptidase [Deltaproteobacteria bacterium]